MCESVELARILDVSGSLLKTTCRQNSALASLTIMAKIRLPGKVESKSTLLVQPEHTSEKRIPNPSNAAFKMSSSLESTTSSRSYSSSPESGDCDKYCAGITSDLVDDVISGVQSMQLYKRASLDIGQARVGRGAAPDSPVGRRASFGYARNIVTSDDEDDADVDEDADEDEEEEEGDDEGLIERGPVRPQMHCVNRSRPYVESAHHWPTGPGLVPPSENSTDYDTSAKEILTDLEYREKIDFCLDKLSDMSQERSASSSHSPAHSEFCGASGYSPPQQQQQQQHQHQHNSRHQQQQQQQQQQQWQQPEKFPSSGTCFVPSITVCDSESSLLEILSRGGFQAAQAAQTPEYNSGASVASSSLACASDNWPDSPASSYNACATSTSRPDSRASSRAQSPGSNNGCGGVSLLNVLGSPMGSPQVSPQNFRNLQRPSSSSSSSQSYCETPSPANYQSPLDQHLEEQLGDNMMARLPVWRDSFESSDTLVNSVDSSELQLQLVEEVIRGDMNVQAKNHPANDMQVVPNCRTTSCTTNVTSSSNYSMSSSNNRMISPGTLSCLDNSDATDDLTNTLLRFVGGEQAIASGGKIDVSCSSTTSGYSSSSSSGEARNTCDGCMQVEQPMKNNFLGTFRNQAKQQPQQQQQSVYQPQCMNLNGAMNVEGLQFSTTSVELMGRNLWQNYSESNSIMGKSPSNNHFSDFQIPETVTTYNSQRSKSSSKCGTKSSSGSERSIAPWPSLNLPSTRASERLKEVTDPREVERAMKNLLKRPLDQLAKGDEDGDTMLMCLAGNPLELRKKLAYLAPLVERLGTIDGALSMLNSRGEDALYLAAMNCPQMAFVAGYLAAAFLQKNIDIGQRLYRSRGDTLVHALAAKGDAHGEVLAELLSLKTTQGNSVFDLSKRNYDGRTALHVAVEAHDSLGRNTKTVSIGTTRLLLENGADPTIREVRCGDTALHLAVSLSCDPSLVKTLLTGKGRDAVNIANYNGNTPLHMAAVISERTSLERQSEICWHLIHAGGRTNLTNRQGKTPLALASVDRKEALRRIFHKKTQGTGGGAN